MIDIARALLWIDLPVYQVHRPNTVQFGDREQSACFGCGQRYPCDAVRGAWVLASLASSWHSTPNDARACDDDTCKDVMRVLDNPQPMNLYPEDDE